MTSFVFSLNTFDYFSKIMDKKTQKNQSIDWF